MIYRAFLKYFTELLPTEAISSLDPKMIKVQKDRKISLASKHMLAKPGLTEAESKEQGNPMVYGTVFLRDMGNYVNEEEGINQVAEYVVKIIDNVTCCAESNNTSRKRYNAICKIMTKRSLNDKLQRVCPEWMSRLQRNEEELMKKHNIDEDELHGK